MQNLTHIVSPEEAGRRLDQFITSLMPDASRSEVQRWIETAQAGCTEGILVNGAPSRPGYKTRAGDTLTICPPEPISASPLPQDIPLDIKYEDEHLLVIDKPRGMVVHPAPGSPDSTLVNAVLAHADDLSGIGGELRPGIVHRLDKDTGGLILVAKSDTAHRRLQEQIQAREVERRYLALVWGTPPFRHAMVEAPIGRHPSDRKKMAVITDSRHTAREARTELFVKETLKETFTLLEAKLYTGRTHQIRVHCAHIHYPIVGDPLYGGERKLPSQPFASGEKGTLEKAIHALNGQALHAFSLAFTHPVTSEKLQFISPLPDPMARLLALLQAA